MTYYRTVATDSREDVTLCAEDVKALRSATMVRFWHDQEKPEVTHVTAIKELPYDDVFKNTGRLERIVPVFSRIEAYDDERTYLVGYELLQSAQVSETWRTVADALRVGDVLSVEYRVNSNGYTRDYGLFLDELLVAILRKGKRAGTFMLSAHVTPDNSARMIRDRRGFY